MNDHNSAGEGPRRFQRITETGADILADHQPVHDNFDMVLFIFLRLNSLGQIIQNAVHPHTGVSAFPRSLQLLLVLTLTAAHHRGHHHNFGALRQGHHLIHNLINGLLADLPPAYRAVGHADTRIQKAQVIIDLGHGPHCGPRVFRGGLLVNGDRRRQPRQLVHVGFIHLPQEHTGIGGQGFHIPALPLGVNRIERQGGLSRTGQAGQHHQLVPGDIQINVFQIMHPRPADADLFWLHDGVFLSYHGKSPRFAVEVTFPPAAF